MRSLNYDVIPERYQTAKKKTTTYNELVCSSLLETAKLLITWKLSRLCVLFYLKIKLGFILTSLLIIIIHLASRIVPSGDIHDNISPNIPILKLWQRELGSIHLMSPSINYKVCLFLLSTIYKVCTIKKTSTSVKCVHL